MAFFSRNKEENHSADLSDIQLPVHVGIIMDGNGRWAKKRGLPRKAGHSEGAKTFRKITRYCSEVGIKYLTVYAFSTENWKRPQDEVNSLMKLFKSYLEEALSDFKDDDIIVKFIGDKSHFTEDLQQLMIENEGSSKNRSGMVLNIAMNYGSRDEIVRAVKNICADVKQGKISLWQAAYTEFVIMNKLWPDFQKSDLDEALRIYSHRSRRYGGV